MTKTKFKKNIAVLAPMAGFTDLPYRYICEECGCEITFTEMINAKAICYNDKKTISMLDTNLQNKDVIVQIFGSEPDYIAEAVKILNSLNRFSQIDINMGCPAPKIVKNGDGSALMKNQKLAGLLVNVAKKNSKIPISVKIRKGFDDNNINAIEFAQYMQENGADSIAVHGRTTKQYYSGVADWDIIKSIKSTLKIPVLGNGDVDSPEKAKQMVDYTGCDGIMIGRAAQGNPLIFKQISDFFKYGKYEIFKDEEKLDIAIRHYKLAIEMFGENIAVREMRKQLNCYLKGIKNSCSVKNIINKETSYLKVIDILDNFKQSLTVQA